MSLGQKLFLQKWKSLGKSMSDNPQEQCMSAESPEQKQSINMDKEGFESKGNQYQAAEC